MTDKPKLKYVYLSKYAGSASGKIEKLKVAKVGDPYEGYLDHFRISMDAKYGYPSWETFALNKECFATFEEAKADAMKRLANRIKAAEKSLAAMKAKTYEEPK